MPINSDLLVIDTNVAIVANGKSDHVSCDCEISCVELLTKHKKLKIALDQDGLIMDEYGKHLNYSGQPGVGDIFFKYLHDNQYAMKNISLHEVKSVDDDSRGFQVLPDNHFDPSDRKLLATAVVARGAIVNATDSDWHENIELLISLNVDVHQICPDYCVKDCL